MAYLIGIDVGTSSTKALLIDESGKVLKSVAPEYEFQTQHSGGGDLILLTGGVPPLKPSSLYLRILIRVKLLVSG